MLQNNDDDLNNPIPNSVWRKLPLWVRLQIFWIVWVSVNFKNKKRGSK